MNIVIADDHALFRNGVRQLLSNEFPDASVTEAGSLDDMLGAMPLDSNPDLLVMDLNMPGVDGVDSIAALIDVFPRAKVVIMSASETRREVGAALAAGVNGYIPKSLTTNEILEALKDVLSGSTYVPLSVTRREALAQRAPEAPPRLEELGLTDRQQHVLDELMLGKSSKEIGRALDITESTVKIHLAAIYRALGVKSRSEAVAKVKRPALLRPQGSGCPQQ